MCSHRTSSYPLKHKQLNEAPNPGTVLLSNLLAECTVGSDVSPSGISSSRFEVPRLAKTKLEQQIAKVQHNWDQLPCRIIAMASLGL